jgi:putative addiction module component (TIGR02574 family)
VNNVIANAGASGKRLFARRIDRDVRCLCQFLLLDFGMIGPAEIERMSVEERLQAIELLWDSISRPGDAVSSPEWHGKVLAARRAKVDHGNGQFLSISELRDRLKPSA